MNISQYLAGKRKPRSSARTWAGQPVQPTIKGGRIIMPMDTAGEAIRADTSLETTKAKRAGGLGGPLPELARELQRAWDTGEQLF